MAYWAHLDGIWTLAAVSFDMGFHPVLVVSLTLLGLSRADTVKNALIYSKENIKDIDADLLKLAAIPSISSLPEHARDIVAASEWLIEKLKAAGLEVNGSFILKRVFIAMSRRRMALCMNAVIRSGRACAECQASPDKGTTFSVC